MNKKFLVLFCVLICTTVILLSPTAVFAEKEIFYDDEIILAPQQRSYDYINYTSKLVEKYTIPTLIPNYKNYNYNLTNCCACVAGAICIGYYDRMCENLVPNFQTYSIIRGQIMYKGMGNQTNMPYLQGIINDLYVSMGTNSIKPGTNETQFINGIASYASSRGYTLSINSVMTNNALNITSLNNELRAGRPVAILTNKFNLLNTYNDNGSKVTLGKVEYLNAHIMMVYGYEQVRYFNGSHNFETNTYLKVSSGLELDLSSGYCWVDDSSFELLKAYSMVIA